MNIAVITAMHQELQAIVRLLDAPDTIRIGKYKACRGTISGHDIVVLESGMGFENAARATETLLSLMMPEIIISAGFCGGIAPELVVGDTVVATRLVIVNGNVLDEIHVEFAIAGSNFYFGKSSSASNVFAGLFISSPAIMSKAYISGLLPADVSCPVVEMESAAVALIAAENGIQFAGIRSVSDPASEELGFSLSEFCDDHLNIRIPLVFLAIMKKPRIIPQLIRLARNSKIAEASLAGAVKNFLKFV